MEQEEFKKLKDENEAYMGELSKRSYEYIYKLRKILSETMDMESQETALHDLLPQVIDAQRKGTTAVQLLGPVQECAHRILHPKKEVRHLKNWQIWVDNTLVTMALLGLVSGLLTLGAKGAVSSMSRIFTYVISSMAGGLTFFYFYKLINQYDLPGADKSKKPSGFKQVLIMIAGALGWWVVTAITGFIPTRINIAVPPLYILIIAGLAYFARYILKQTWGYKTQFFTIYYDEEE